MTWAKRGVESPSNEAKKAAALSLSATNVAVQSRTHVEGRCHLGVGGT